MLGLDLTKNNLDLVGAFPNVNRIRYSDNSSTKLPAEIATSGVKHLELNETKKFKKLPKDLAKMTQLESLLLINISGLSDLSVLSELKNLRFLHIFAISRTTDFSVLKHLENLEEVHLCSMYLDELPSVLAELPNLKRLNLSGGSKVSKDLRNYLWSTAQ